jgi:hypothetical protein
MARPKEIEEPCEYSIMIARAERDALDACSARISQKPLTRAALTRLAVQYFIRAVETGTYAKPESVQEPA